MKRLTAALTVIVILAITASCAKAPRESFNIYSVSNYQDIEGVTPQEIEEIEALKRARSKLTYGQMLETEAFILPDGTYAGFAQRFCDFLTGLFGVEFELELYEWETLKSGIDAGRIDFTGDLTATPERMQQYYMTHPIAERSLRAFTLAGGHEIHNEKDVDGLKVGSLTGTIDIEHVMQYYPELTFSIVDVDSFDTAAAKLKSREIDMFVTEGVIDPIFDKYGDIKSQEFFPLVYTSVSLTTANPELRPIINVVNRYLSAGGIDMLFDFYKDGSYDYARYKLGKSFTADERNYLNDLVKSNASVKVALEPDNYPICFYNKADNEFQGIAVDVLAEISSLTGMRFETANDENTTWSETMDMLRSGRVSLVSQLLHTAEREGSFLWSATPYASAYYALISKTDYPNLSSYQIVRSRVGSIRKSAFEDKYIEWFADNDNLVLYDDQIAVLDALESGEVDLLMGSNYLMLMQQNYREKPGYKINIRFSTPMDSNFGFNLNETTLCSIMNKAQHFVRTDIISDDWTSRGYDYAKQIAQQRSLYFIVIASVLAAVVFFMVFSLLRKRKQNLVLDEIVKERTAELENMAADIRATVAKLQAVIASYSGIIWSTDLDNTITLFDGMYLSEIGVTPEFLEGKKLDAARSKNRHMDIIEYTQKTISEGPQHWISNVDGKMFRANTTPVYDELGNVTGVMGNIDDMTEIFQLQKELEDALVKAEAASKAKSEFLSTMSHEIRTPMNAILGITEIQLQGAELSRNVREALEKIYNSGDMLLGIINDILDLSRIEAGKLELMIAQYETAGLISDTAQLNVMRIGEKPIVFELNVDENLPRLLSGDELRVKQILNNLLSNAFKYTAEGTVVLSISLEAKSPEASESGDDSAYLLFTVSDTGQGMNEDQVSKLFDEYSRFNMAANRTTEGTGLGMSITRNLIRLMNGEITVESEPGIGSVFTVRLPQGRIGAGKLGGEMAKNLKQFRTGSIAHMKRAQITYEPMPYGSVLIVDDVETNIYVAQGLMMPYGLKIDTADSGFDAIEKVQQGKTYDIIFMDHMMPNMDGIEATQKIRDIGYYRPIVALTANAVAGQAEIFLGSGFDDFISKPIDVRQLNAALNKYIRDKQPADVLENARSESDEKKSRLHGGMAGGGDGAGGGVGGVGGGGREDAGSAGGGRLSDGRGAAHDDEQTPDVDPLFAEIFARDAGKALAILEAISAGGDYGNEDDLRSYIINIHGMKSALANVKNMQLSSVAQMLEAAGREGRLDALRSETPAFISSLRAFVERIVPAPESNGDAPVDEDMSFLREKLALIKTACEEYDERAADTVLTELREAARSQPAKALIDAVSGHLLHSDFDEAIQAIEDYLGNHIV